MRRCGSILCCVGLFAFFLATAICAEAGSKYKVLHAFTGGADGGGLYAGLVCGTDGTLYAGTSGGGAYGQGTVFKLVFSPGGRWAETVLHDFSLHSDGESPIGTLALDAAGNLYGTTVTGGSNDAGTVFELSPNPTSPGAWSFRVLYESGSDAALILDTADNLYGPLGAGKYGDGAISELSPGSDGWTEKVLHNFCSWKNCDDGVLPQYGLTWDAAGNLYGVTTQGGVYKAGGAFELEHTSGLWKEHVLHNFRASRSDGYAPHAGLVFDGSGNLYGTTEQGGNNASGTVFQLSRQQDGRWKETILYDFPNGSYDGQGPAAGLVFDKAGNLYGTTSGGGDTCSCGVVFKMTPRPGGKWKYTVLHRFTGADGWVPQASLIFDKDYAHLYGTTTEGGPRGYGVVFRITP